MGVDECRDGSIPNDLGSGTGEDGSSCDLVDVLGNSDDPVRIVSREIGVDEMAPHLLGDIGVGANGPEQSGGEPMQRFRRTGVEISHERSAPNLRG
jgi:hypothetical protein